MAKSKTTKTKSKKAQIKKLPADNNLLVSAAAILFAGGCVILLGNMQGVDNLKLIMVGFGAAMLVLGGVLLGSATRSSKR